jgi:hypothetical protein
MAVAEPSHCSTSRQRMGNVRRKGDTGHVISKVGSDFAFDRVQTLIERRPYRRTAHALPDHAFGT